MKKTIIYYKKCGSKASRVVKAEPVCGKDFCAYCHECLACSSSKCIGKRKHIWQEHEPVDTDLLKWR